jgi:Fic-DOC domain mobile mystery protein B
MTRFPEPEDGTPLSTGEQEGLIPNLATRQELNEWERANILLGLEWAFNQRGWRRLDPLSETFVRELHRRMFDQTWRWAGTYRASEKNLGVPHFQVREAVAVLLGDARFWIEHQTYPPDEIAVRLHHRMVVIHPFANGNGRHARLLADVLARKLGRPEFSWGAASTVRNEELRRRYIHALRMADKNEIGPLLEFARS